MFSRRLWFHQICSLYNDPLRLKKKIKEDWEKNTHHGWTEWNQRGFDRQSERASGKAFANGDVAGWWGWASGGSEAGAGKLTGGGRPPRNGGLIWPTKRGGQLGSGRLGSLPSPALLTKLPVCLTCCAATVTCLSAVRLQMFSLTELKKQFKCYKILLQVKPKLFYALPVRT